jgi:hypothetical protein
VGKGPNACAIAFGDAGIHQGAGRNEGGHGGGGILLR